MNRITLFFMIIILALCICISTSVSAAETLQPEESLIYQPKYLPAEVLKNKLSYPDLRIAVIEEKDYLLLQGTENKLKEAEESLNQIDSRETPYQVKYTLTVIDLSRETNSKFDFSAAGISSEEGENVAFLSEEQVLELYSPEVMDYLEVEAAAGENLSQRIAQPAVVTTFGESGSISFSEEYFGLEEELHDTDASSLEVNFNPQQLNSEQGIKSRVELVVNEVRELNTTTWTEPGEETLLGLMTLKQQQEKNSIFGQEENTKKRSFAVYMTAEIKNSQHSESREQESFFASLDGADQMLLNLDNDNVPERKNYIQLLGGENNPQLDFHLESSDSGISTELFSREEDFVNLGVSFPIRKGLKLGGALIHQQDKSFSLGFSISDYLRFGDKFWFAASYLPLIYNFEADDINTNHGWIEAGYNPGSIFIKIRYSSDYVPHNLRLETGFKIFNNFYLTAAGVGDTSGIEYYLGGIRLDF